MEEKELIDRIRDGDKDAFVVFVDKYKKKIVSLCYSYTSDYGEAEDLSQEVFIAFYKNISNFRGDSLVSTYLYRITINICLNFKKKNNIKSFLGGLFNVHKEHSLNLDDKTYVRQCIRELPEDLKNVIVLYYYIGLSYKEIGDILGISERAVEGRLYRAKQKLKVKLENGEVILWSNKGTI